MRSPAVCAAVSALTLTLIKALHELTYDETSEGIRDGNVIIEWQSLSDIGRALVDVWFLEICSIAADNGYIEII